MKLRPEIENKANDNIVPFHPSILTHHVQDGYYEMRSTGLFFIHEVKGIQKELWISDAIRVLAKISNPESKHWGLLLQWKDSANVVHERSFAMSLLQTDGTELRKTLVDMGLMISTDKYAKTRFLEFLATLPVEKLAKKVSRVGWYENQYITPSHIFGENLRNEMIIYEYHDPLSSQCCNKGTLEEWQIYISKLSESHKYLVLAICVAFSGQILELLSHKGGGVHFKGQSSKGKSTALNIASSIWSDPEKYYRTWRNTSNALEKTACSHNDGLITLDEIGEYPFPKELGTISYMLVNGMGKTRMTKEAELQETSQWKLVFISSGEKTMNEMMQEAGQETNLGQEIRFINIDIDDSEFGIFHEVTFAEDAATQANVLNSNTKKFHGVAGIEWLNYLTKDKSTAQLLARQLYDEYKNSLSEYNQHGHLQRVADFFALIATAGEMATQAGITGWNNGTALNAIQEVYNDWLSKFKYVGNFREKQILTQVRAFFEAHSNSRFELINPPLNSMGYEPMQKIQNRVGFIKNNPNDNRKFLVFSDKFKTQICGKFDYKEVRKILKKYGWLDCDKEGNIYQKNERIPEGNKSVQKKMYVFNEKMWEWSDDE
ncbi:DUF927 domain-containing protein [Acinetobacter towneri]|uniref:DUF927 domain-containing protein n=1 Tax=Acinetobacter towneri TaxID=202956 RepID=UPI003A87B750